MAISQKQRRRYRFAGKFHAVSEVIGLRRPVFGRAFVVAIGKVDYGENFTLDFGLYLAKKIYKQDRDAIDEFS